jgi:hypothetical protein
MRVLVGRLSHPTPVGENIALADLKDDIDRILADDGCGTSKGCTRLPTVK